MNKKGNTARPQLATQALLSVRKSMGSDERVRAIQFVIHTGEIYEPIIEQYRDHAGGPGA